MDREGLFNLARFLRVSRCEDQELVGHFPIEFLFLLCKFLSREGCGLEFSPTGVRILEEDLWLWAG